MRVNKLLKEELESVFKELSVNIIEDTRITITAKKRKVLAVLRFLKDKGFEHLALISCVDWIEENDFELVYILAPYMQSNEEYTDREKVHLIVKIRISREEPQFETITNLFQNAEPYEREIYELFGVKFEGHKRLIPLFLERNYEVPPFRKDFDTRKYVKDVFDKIPSIDIESK
jgi:NADH-quinone oxidoreductase subunit C